MKAVSVTLSRLESDLQMARKAAGTIQQYLSSIRIFEAFLGREVGQASPEDLRAWVGHLQRQPIGAPRLRCNYSALTFLASSLFCMGKRRSKTEGFLILAGSSKVCKHIFRDRRFYQRDNV